MVNIFAPVSIASIPENRVILFNHIYYWPIHSSLLSKELLQHAELAQCRYYRESFPEGKLLLIGLDCKAHAHCTSTSWEEAEEMARKSSVIARGIAQGSNVKG